MRRLEEKQQLMMEWSEDEDEEAEEFKKIQVKSVQSSIVRLQSGIFLGQTPFALARKRPVLSLVPDPSNRRGRGKEVVGSRMSLKRMQLL